MVAHAWIGFEYTFEADKLHFDNYDALVHRAQQNGIQIAFEKELPENAFEGIDVVSCKSTGKMYTIVVRGDLEKAMKKFNSYKPVYNETLPLTLEEIFISEMEEHGYDYSKINV
jgi:ABC-2 type transport system ATP-binding protein